MIVDIHEFISKSKRHWEEEGFVKLNEATAREIGFTALDAWVMSTIGLPKWVAPHIALTSPEQIASGRWLGSLVIGEDQFDNNIIYKAHCGELIVDVPECGESHVAVGVFEFICQIIYYADMIESAVENGDRLAAKKNRITERLVSNFEQNLLQSVSGVTQFWKSEIARLRRG